MIEVMPPRRRIAPHDAASAFLLVIDRAWITADDLRDRVPAVPVADLEAFAREVSKAIDDAIMLARQTLQSWGTVRRKDVRWLARVAAAVDGFLEALAACPSIDPAYAGHRMLRRAYHGAQELNLLVDQRLLEAMLTRPPYPALAGLPPSPRWSDIMFAVREVVTRAEKHHAAKLTRGRPPSPAPRVLARRLSEAFLRRFPKRRKAAPDFVQAVAALARQRIRQQLLDGAELAAHLMPPKRLRARRVNVVGEAHLGPTQAVRKRRKTGV